MINKISKHLLSKSKRCFSMIQRKTNKNLPSFHEDLEKELKKVNNINSLFYYLNEKNNDFLQIEYKFIRVISKYRDFDSLEPNSNMKAYVFLDYLIRKDIKYSISMIKSLMSLMFSKEINEEVYWDFIYEQIVKEDLLSNGNNFIDIMKGFAIIPYENNTLWKEFEDITLKKYEKLEIDEVETIILCFVNKKQGSQELLKELIEYSKENSNEGDIIINYTLSIIKNFRNYDIYHKFIKYSIDYISDKILKLEETKPTLQSIQNIDLIYSLLPGFHRLLRGHKSYKLTDRYDKEDLANFVIGLEKVIGKFIELEIHKFEEQDILQISNIIRYIIDEKTHFKLIKTKNIISFFKKCYKSIKDYKIILNYFTYFKNKEVPQKYFCDIIKFDVLFEQFIENVHLMEYKELFELLSFCKFYELHDDRLFVFIQNNLRKYIFDNELLTINDNTISYEQKNHKVDYYENRLSRVNDLLELLKDNGFYMTDQILLPFIQMLEHSKGSIEIKLSWLKLNNLI